jgi:hypothetical protein
VVEIIQMFLVTSSKVCLCALGRSCFLLLLHPPILMERTTPLVIDQVKVDVLSAHVASYMFLGTKPLGAGF